MPHSQPTALQQSVCKFHLDPQYHISHWGLTILGDSTLCVLFFNDSTCWDRSYHRWRIATVISVSLLQTYWRYFSRALSHRYRACWFVVARCRPILHISYRVTSLAKSVSEASKRCTRTTHSMFVCIFYGTHRKHRIGVNDIDSIYVIKNCAFPSRFPPQPLPIAEAFVRVRGFKHYHFVHLPENQDQSLMSVYKGSRAKGQKTGGLFIPKIPIYGNYVSGCWLLFACLRSTYSN